MINLINKTDFTIVTFNSEREASIKSKVDYVRISDALVNEIKGKYYQDGTYMNELGEVLPNMVDLELILPFNEGDFESVEGSIFKEVVTLNFKDRQSAIGTYNNSKINDSFKGKKYKFFVENLDDLLPLSFSQIMLSIEKNKRIITEELPQYLEDDIMIMPFNIYADNIKPSDLTKLNEAIAAGLIVKTENPFYNQF